jgi:hypothetical protein
MDAPILALTEDDAVNAIRTFQSTLDASAGLKDRLPNARAWFALPDDGRWIFAPAKWVGYRHMTPERYLADASTAMDGRKVEKRLRQWFVPLEPHTTQHAELHTALAAFLAEYDKQPNGVARISLLHAATSAADQDDLVELLLRVIRGLDRAQQARVRRALDG